MDIYFGRFLESDGLLLTGGAYYEYFNSEESIYNYVNVLRSLGKEDVLEKIGKVTFTKKGRLVPDEKTEKIIYDPEGKNSGDDIDIWEV